MKDDQPDIVVHDYARSVNANYDDMLREAALVSEFADEVATAARDLQGVLIDADLLASAALNPVGVAKAEFELFDALDGPRGLVALALTLEIRAFGLRTSVEALRAADATLGALAATAEWGAGLAVGAAASAWLPPALGAGAVLWLDATYNGGRLGEALGDRAAPLERWLVENARFVDTLAGAAPGLLTGLTRALPVVPDVMVFTLSQGAGSLAWLYRNGTGQARVVAHVTAPDAPRPASDAKVSSLLGGLDAIDRLSTEDGRPVVQVRKMVGTGPDGTPTARWVVYIPGTSKWHLAGSDPNPANTGGIVHSMAGHETAYQQAVRDALRKAGAHRGEQVMLVGHSLGGMVAMQSATGLTAEGYAVTHVLTAGTPLADYTVPDSVRVLSLENTADVVPRLDSAPNLVTRNRTTVTFEDQHGTVRGNHDITTGYLAGAGSVDDSGEAALAAWRESAAGFFEPPARMEADPIYAVSRT